MPRKLLKSLLVSASVTLAGCSGSESTVFPEDGREQNNPVNNHNPDTLSGYALDGYLRHAYVWLDLNANGLRDEGEPADRTGAGGLFELDIRSMQQDPSVGRGLDPDNYPLMLLAIPGTTVDESDGAPVERGYFLMAPPGVKVVTPFTTLIEFERRSHTFAPMDSPEEQVVEATRRVKARLGPELSGFSLQLDYLHSGHRRAAAYAQALGAFLEAQTSVDRSQALASGDREVFGADLINVLGALALLQAPDVVSQATALLAQNGVENFDPRDLNIPVFELDNADPHVLTEQYLYVDRALTRNSDPSAMTQPAVDLVRDGKEGNLSAVLKYFYDPAGRLTRIDINGWTEPDLGQLHDLIRVRGQVSQLETQRSPGLLLRYSRAADLNDDVDERYFFKWQERRIEWDTTNPEYGAALAELDGAAEQIITWTPDQERPLESIVRSTAAGQPLETLEIDHASSEPWAITRYRFIGSAGVVDKTWVWHPIEASCRAIDVYDGSNISDTAARTYFDNYSPAGNLVESNRTVDYAGAGGLTDVKWFNSYYEGAQALDPSQPGMLKQRILTLLTRPAAGCESSDSDRALAVTRYEYRRLSSRLSEQVVEE